MPAAEYGWVTNWVGPTLSGSSTIKTLYMCPPERYQVHDPRAHTIPTCMSPPEQSGVLGIPAGHSRRWLARTVSCSWRCAGHNAQSPVG